MSECYHCFLSAKNKCSFGYKTQEEMFENQFGSSTGFKMKFLVLLFATAALASAAFIGGKYIDVKEDGTIYIKGEDGKQVYITKHYGPYGKNIKIEVTGPNDFTKVYDFEYNTVNKAYDSQHDVLDVIFKEYLGHVDEYTYQQLLNKVQKAVMNGYFDSQFLYVLQALVEGAKWDNLVSGQMYHGQVGEVLNKLTQQDKYGLGFYGKLFNGRGFYGQDYYNNQYDVHYYYNILMKIFDRAVLKDVLVQGQMYEQEFYGKYSYEKLWDVIFTHEGIFDYQYLVEIINNPVWRTWFVQHGYFDKVVLDKILYTYKTEGVYDHYLMQHLFNTQVLKYFFINHGVSVYDILGQTGYKQYYGNTFYNKGFYGYDILEKMIYDPYWRNVMVQYGIFHKNILDQILYHYKTEGVYDQVLLRQLVDKEALYTVLVQYGVDQTLLKQFIDNEYLGLGYIYKNNFFQQTPRWSFKHFMGGYGYTPEYNNYMYEGNYRYNQLYQGYKQGPYNYGKFFYQYPLVQPVY